MSSEPEPPGPRSHPLEGVLDRLIARERGAAAPPSPLLEQDGRAEGGDRVERREPWPRPDRRVDHPPGDPVDPVNMAQAASADAAFARPTVAGGAPVPLPASPITLCAPLLGFETGLSIAGASAAGTLAPGDWVRSMPAPAPEQDSGRRMLVVAGQGADRGREALRAATRWAVRNGKRAAILDLIEPGSEAGADIRPPAGAPQSVVDPRWAETRPPVAQDPFVETAAGDAEPRPGRERLTVPFASIPCGLDRLRDQPPELLANVIDRLRHHEIDADFLVVRIPAHPRMLLMKATFMAGGLIVPLDGSDQSMWEEFYLCQEVQQNFYGMTLWPWARDRQVLERFLTLLRNFLGVEAAVFDADSGDPAAVLERLSAAPEEGYVAGLLAQGAASPSPHLLDISSIEI